MTGEPTKAIRVSSTGLVVDSDARALGVLEFADSVMRGIGQVMLQNNAFSGALFLIGVFFSSVLFGFAVVVGTAVSTATAILLGGERTLVRSGVFGFNGALVAIALLYYLQPDAVTWGYVVVAAAVSTVVMGAMIRVLQTWNAPALTAPFVVTTLWFVLASARFGRLVSAHALPIASLPKAGGVEGLVTASTLLEGLFRGVAQVFFQSSVVSGIVFLGGLVVSSRRACVSALAGSSIGAIVAWLTGASAVAIRSGAFGFNSVLTAVALGGVFIVLEMTSAAYVALAAAVAAVVFAALSAALEPVGMPALTAPFVLVVWVFVLAVPSLPRLRRA